MQSLLVEIMIERQKVAWNNYQSTLSRAFEIMKDDEDFCDVTLVSDDEVHVKAHKLVLSACSVFFKNILRSNYNLPSVLYLGNVKSEDLFHIINYAYSGEVQLFNHQLDNFLSIAKKLKIEGIESPKFDKNSHCQENFYEKMLKVQTNAEIETSKEIKQDIVEDAELSENSVLLDEEEEELEDDEVDQLEKIMEDPQPQNQPKQCQKKKNVIKLSDTSKLDTKIEELIEKKKGYSQCKICGKNIRGINLMRYHVETHIKGLKFPCDKCSKICKSRDGLRKHQSNPKLCVINNT